MFTAALALIKYRDERNQKVGQMSLFINFLKYEWCSKGNNVNHESWQSLALSTCPSLSNVAIAQPIQPKWWK